MMKCRTITLFLSLKDRDSREWAGLLDEAASFLVRAKEAVEECKVDVQTLRISTNLLSAERPNLLEDLVQLERHCLSRDIRFLNAGRATAATRHLVPELLRLTTVVSASIELPEGLEPAEAEAVAGIVLDTADATADGAGNFRLAASAACDDTAIPYFPASHCAGSDMDRGFALGLENSGLLHRAFSTANGSLRQATENLRTLTAAAAAPLCAAMASIGRGSGFSFLGIDTSIAPALEGPSIAGASPPRS